MKGRTLSQEGYRYGFNGKENDTDFGNSQLIQDYGFRLYNPSIAKFLSVDPLAPDYPWYTPYQFAGNTPIQAIDLDGAEPFSVEHLQEALEHGQPAQSVEEETQVFERLKYAQTHPFNVFLRPVLKFLSQFAPVSSDVQDLQQIASDVKAGNYTDASITAVFLLPGGDLLKVGNVGGKVAREVIEEASTNRGIRDLFWEGSETATDYSKKYKYSKWDKFDPKKDLKDNPNIGDGNKWLYSFDDAVLSGSYSYKTPTNMFDIHAHDSTMNVGGRVSADQLLADIRSLRDSSDPMQALNLFACSCGAGQLISDIAKKGRILVGGATSEITVDAAGRIKFAGDGVWNIYGPNGGIVKTLSQSEASSIKKVLDITQSLINSQ